MADSVTTGRTGGGGEGFWSQLGSGLGEGLGAIGSQILPVWAAKELKVQQVDQLDQATYNNLYGAPRLDDQLRTTGQSPVQKNDDTLLGFDKTAVMIVGGGLLLAGVVFLVAR